jgi:hypothetical protein
VLLARAHLDRIDQRPARLLLEVLRTTVPELGRVEDRVQHSRRVARTALPPVPDRRLLHVDPTHADNVTGIASDGVALRQARLEVEHLAELDALRGGFDPRQGRCLGRDRLEHPAGGIHELVRVHRGSKSPQTSDKRQVAVHRPSPLRSVDDGASRSPVESEPLP